MDIETSQNRPVVFTTTQVAQQLCCHPKTVRAMCQAGKLRAVKLGTEWRVPVAALEAFIAGGEVSEDGC